MPVVDADLQPLIQCCCQQRSDLQRSVDGIINHVHISSIRILVKGERGGDKLH